MRPDPFEESIRNSLDGFEPGGAAEAWSAIESRVLANNESHLGQQRNQYYTKAALVAAGVGLAIAAWLVSPFSESSSAPELTQATTPIEPTPTEEASALPISSSEDKEVETTPTIETVAAQSVAVTTPSFKNNTPHPEAKKQSPKRDDHRENPTVSAPVWQLSNTALCQGEQLNWKVAGTSDKKLVVLINDKKVDANANGYIFDQAGEYKIALARKVKRELRVLDSRQIVVHANDGADFTYEKQKDYKAPVVAFHSNMLASNNRWFVDDELISEDAQVSHLFRNKGRYSIKLVTENQNGCKDSSVQTIRILRAYNLMASSVFNPDQEKWMPYGLKGNKEAFELKVMNPQGEVVFESSDANNEWDGSDANSSKLKAENGEMYLWVARVTNDRGTIMEYGGSILVSYYEE